MTQPPLVDQKMVLAAERILGTEVSDTLRTRMRQLPQRLRGSGLAATYAFLLSKREGSDDVARAYDRLTKAIPEHLAEQGLVQRQSRPENLLNAIASLELTQYARITAEIDALAVWLSRLADALNKRPGATRGQGDTSAT